VGGINMAKLNIVIAECDVNYARGLLEYINSNHFSSFMASCFTKLDSFAAYFEKQPPVDILIISPDFYDISVEGLEVKLKIILSDGVLKREYPGYQVVNKYNTGDKLIGEVLYLYSKTNNQEIRLTSGSKNTEFVGVYSPAGGTGKSTIAAALATQCIELGIRSFYLNLESIQSTGVFFNSYNKRNLSYVFYYLKEKCRNLSFKMDGIKCTEDGVEYFNPPESPMEYEEINPEELEQLLKGIKDMGCYDYVFIDMYSNFDLKNYKIMELCDRIVLVSLYEPIASHKRKILFNELAKLCDRDKGSISDKFIIVINKHKGRNDEDIENLEENIPAAVRIPEFSNTLIREDGRIFNDDDNFRRAINRIIDIISCR
jgi:cellulose biosynthesis protein BcsQ